MSVLLLWWEWSFRIDFEEIFGLNIEFVVDVIEMSTLRDDGTMWKTCLDVAEISSLLRELVTVNFHDEVAVSMADVVLGNCCMSILEEAGACFCMVGTHDDTNHLLAGNDCSLKSSILCLLDVLGVDETVGFLAKQWQSKVGLIIELHIIVGKGEVELCVCDICEGSHCERGTPFVSAVPILSCLLRMRNTVSWSVQ